MRKLTIVVGLLATVAFAGCKKKDEATEKPPETPTATAPPVETPPPAPGAGEPGAAPAAEGTGGGMGGMGGTAGIELHNCPRGVPTAATTVADTKDAVVVTVVAKDSALTNEIRGRGQKLAEASKAGAEIKTGVATCPVVFEDTTIEYAEVEGGAKLTVKPKKPDGLAALAAESKRRSDALEP